MKKNIKKVIASSLAFICTLAVGITAFSSGCNSATEDSNNHQLSFSNFIGNGMTIKALAEEATTTSTEKSDTRHFILSEGFSVYTLDELGYGMTDNGEDLFYHARSGYYNENMEFIQDSNYASLGFVKTEMYTYFDFSSYRDIEFQVLEFSSVIPDSNSVLLTSDANDFSVWRRESFQLNPKTQYVYIQARSSTLSSSDLKNCFVDATFSIYKYSGDSVTFKASVYPESYVTLGIDWSLSWSNPNSNWVTEENRQVEKYVELIPDSNDTTIVRLNLLKAFGEQIILKAKLRVNPNINAECTVDCRKIIKKASYTFDCTNKSNNESCTYRFTNYDEGWEDKVQNVDVLINDTASDYNSGFTPEMSLSAGTLTEHYTSSAYLEISNGLKNSLVAQGLTVDFDSMRIDNGTNLFFDTNFFKEYFGIDYDTTDYDSLIEAIKNNTDLFDFKIVITFTNRYNTLRFEGKLKINALSMRYTDESLVLNYGSIIF